MFIPSLEIYSKKSNIKVSDYPSKPNTVEQLAFGY